MDKISLSLLADFTSRFGISELPEDQRFEQFATWLTVRRHYSETKFDPADLVTETGGDTGIDAIAIIVNNNIVTDIDTIAELITVNNYLDVTFVFVQAERSEHFDGGKIGTFGYGVRDFFGDARLPKGQIVQNFIDIMNAIYSQSGKFKPDNPKCIMYYVTTGTWQDDATLSARIHTEVNLLKATNQFSSVDFHAIGASDIQRLDRQAKNAITRLFRFDRKNSLPKVAGVDQAYLGYIPAKVYLDLIKDERGELIRSLFYENVRDFGGYNEVNTEIRKTLASDSRDRFVFMNNGVTIIAKEIRTTADDFTISDFYVVNGCQTSNVLYENQTLLTDEVHIPFRLIGTKDNTVFESVIRATNRQTAVKSHQFFAMEDFAKRLEEYFKAFPLGGRLYYERRSNQYNSDGIEQKRIIVHEDLVRAVGAMFLGEPHITTKTFRALKDKVGIEMFNEADRMEPYYLAALALYNIEAMGFKGQKVLDAKYKPARYQILLAIRLLMNPEPLPFMNSHSMKKRCEAMISLLDDNDKVAELLNKGAAIIDTVGGPNWDRDSIRTEPITKAIFEHFGQRYERRRQETREADGD